MPVRVSSRLTSKVTGSSVSNKENSLERLSSPPATPAPAKGKVVARQEAASKKPNSTVSRKAKSDAVPVIPRSTVTSKSAAKRSDGNNEVKNEDAIPTVAEGTKRKRISSSPKHEEDNEELPHNMGKHAPEKPKVKEEDGAEAESTPRKNRASTSAKKQEEDQDMKELAKGAEGPPTKKTRKKPNPYGLAPGETPFPDWSHPTVDECKIVHDLLMSTIEPDRRKRFVPPDDIPAPSEVVAGCGEVPSILDALIRTLLSAATNGKNSSNAFQGLVQRFGLATVGIGKGSVNWNAVHEAPLEEVFEAIKTGGLAKNKSKNIKKILEIVRAENKERLAALLKAKEAGDFDQMDDKSKAEKELELRMLQQGALTLDYYHVLEKDDAITTFTALPGIGVKTAACVNLFCMQRPCFAVDTHVFRLCQYLGWVPPDNTRGERQKKADRNTTFSHCEVMIPDELKYGLHALFIQHGKTCPRCRAITGERSEGWADANCVIEHLVKRTGAKKGGVDSPKKKAKKKKGEDSDDETSVSEHSGDEPTPRVSTFTKETNSPRKGITPKKITTPAKAAKGAKGGSVTKPPKTKVATRTTAATRAKTAKGKKAVAIGMESEEDEDEMMSELTDEAEPSAAEDEN